MTNSDSGIESFDLSWLCTPDTKFFKNTFSMSHWPILFVTLDSHCHRLLGQIWVLLCAIYNGTTSCLWLRVSNWPLLLQNPGIPLKFIEFWWFYLPLPSLPCRESFEVFFEAVLKGVFSGLSQCIIIPRTCVTITLCMLCCRLRARKFVL